MGAADPRHPGSLIVLAAALLGCKHASHSSDPPVVASAKLGVERGVDGFASALDADGNLTAVIEDAVVSVGPDGRQRWKTALDVAPWLVALDDGSILVGDDQGGTLVALDPASGAERWRVAPPPTGDADDDRSPEAVARDGDGVVVALADGRLFRLDRSHALTPMFALHEALDTPDLLVTPDHGVVLIDIDGLRAFDRTGSPGAHLVPVDLMGSAAVLPDGHLAVTIDDQVVLVDLAGCAAVHAPVSLAKADDCGDCVLAPPTCVIARPDLHDVDETAPSPFADGSFAVTDGDGLAVLAPDGKIRWTADKGGFGPLRTAGDTVVVLTAQVGDDLESSPTTVVALDAATGAHRWATRLGAEADLLADAREVTLEVAGTWLVAGYRGEVSWLHPKAPPAAR